MCVFCGGLFHFHGTIAERRSNFLKKYPFYQSQFFYGTRLIFESSQCLVFIFPKGFDMNVSQICMRYLIPY